MNNGDILATMDLEARQAWEWRFRNEDRAAAHAAFEKAKEAYAAVAVLIDEHLAMTKLLEIQDEVMCQFRELVEHRNRQIIALGGEP